MLCLKTVQTLKAVNDDGTELGTNSVENGTSPVYDGETPTKESTAQYTYTFKGWTSDGGTTVYTDELPTGTENVTYTAVFEETVNEYTVTWQYDDGTVIDTETVAYGETPTHADATKEGCTFAGWTPEITAVTGNATYTAVFTYNDGVGRLAGYTLSLDGDIGLNFYTELAPEIAQSETAVMHFTVSNGSKTTELDIPVSQATVKGNYYIFKCNVAAKDMNAVITGQIIDGDNVGTEYSYSVKDYANYLIENADENGTDRQKEYAAQLLSQRKCSNTVHTQKIILTRPIHLAILMMLISILPILLSENSPMIQLLRVRHYR